MSIVQAASGAQHLTVRLEPAELGQVEVRVDRTAGAPVRVEVTVQRPETLTLLLHDQPQLQRALDQAGLPPEGRNLTFNIAPPSPSPAGQPHGGDFTGLAGDGLGNGTHPGFGGQHGSNSHAMLAANDETPDDMPPVPVRWLHAGIDITA